MGNNDAAAAVSRVQRGGCYAESFPRRIHPDAGRFSAGAACYALHEPPRRPPEAHSVGAIVRAFKSAVTRAARTELSHCGRVWQRNYYEHVIRNDKEYLRACSYVRRNPEEWELDREDGAQ